MSTRRDRFREQTRRLDATGPTEKAFIEGWFRDRPGPGLAEQIAAPLDLKDGTSLALVGGVGSGKSTELAHVKRVLQASDPRRVVGLVDVGARVALSGLGPGVLVTLAGQTIAEELKARGLIATQSPDWWRDRLLGFRRERWERDDEDEDGLVFVPGIASPPPPRHGALGAEIATTLRKAGDRISGALVLFDGLDRLTDTAPWLNLRAGVNSLSELGVGALYVAPSSFHLNPAHRSVASMFDQALDFPYLDVEHEPAARAFMLEVLGARTLDDLLPNEVTEALVRLSGGVLRDLLELAQLAVQESYARREDRVSLVAVQQAADRFGRKKLLGVSEDQLETLHSLRRRGRFALTTDATVALVVGGQVLHYEGPRFAVHPCVDPILKELDPGEMAVVY